MSETLSPMAKALIEAQVKKVSMNYFGVKTHADKDSSVSFKVGLFLAPKIV